MKTTITPLVLATGLAGMLMTTAGLAAPVSPKTPAELRTALRELMQKHQVPGASYAVFDRNGLLQAGVVGVADQDKKTPVGERTLFRIGSITKTVTAAAVMQLVEQGRFRLDTPVKALLPDAPIQNPYESTEPVRVIHLLSHTAGFDDTRPKAFFSPSEWQGSHLEAALANPEPYAVRWQPGLYHSYSNPGYTLLGAILEAQYRQSWEVVVRRQVLEPLGMGGCKTRISEAQQLDHAMGHSGEDRHTTGLPFEPSQADGALWCSAQDLAKLGRFLLSDGASAPGVLRPETLAEMKRPQGTVGARAGLMHGYGLGLFDRTVDGVRWKGHTGAVLGQLASMSFHAEAGQGYVLLVNSDNALRKLEAPLAGAIRQSTGWQPAEAAATPLTGDVDGWYRVVNPRASLLDLPTYLFTAGRFQSQGETLEYLPVLPKLGMSAQLKHFGNGRLGDADDGYVVASTVVRDGAGRVAGVSMDGNYLQRISAWSAVAPAVNVILALPLLLSVPFGRRKALSNRWLRRLPSLALLTLLAGFVCAASLSAEAAARMSWQVLGVFAATTALPLFAWAGLGLSLYTWRQESATLAKWRCLLGSGAAVTLSLWLAAFHGFALALWAY